MSRARLSTAACSRTMLAIVTIIGIVVLFLHERHLMGDKGEDTGCNTRVQLAQQKQVNVSEFLAGKIRNDVVKIRHLKLLISGFSNFEIRKKLEKRIRLFVGILRENSIYRKGVRKPTIQNCPRLPSILPNFVMLSRGKKITSPKFLLFVEYSHSL